VNAMTQPAMNLVEFLAWENEQTDKHEFHRGEVFAMVGARRAHGCVVGNLMRHLGNQLAASPCRAFSEGMKLRVADDTILYPDVFVTCDKDDLKTDQVFVAPKLVIEVLSPSTQSYDRSQKFALYRRVSSLQEYVLIDPETKRIEAFRRGPDGLWVFHDMSDGDSFEAPCIGASVKLMDVFAGIDPPA
jgi:Uma2 family endonuclease